MGVTPACHIYGMDKLLPAEATKRFGELHYRETKAHREFDEPEGGVWRPVYVDGVLDHYRLYKLRKLRRAPRARNFR